MPNKSRAAVWRKWNNIFHRDLGYVCAGLTLVYVVSGVAVNHVADWNPNFKVEVRAANVGPLTDEDLTDPSAIADILRSTAVHGAIRGTFRPDPETVRIFTDDGTVTVDLASGAAEIELVSERPVLRAVNFLHLNHPKKLWTWIADLYAVSLGVLAITGLFVLKGKKGITGRGAWLTGAGVVVPVFFLWLYL